MANLILRMDKDFNIVYANKKIINETHFTKEELKVISFWNLIKMITKKKISEIKENLLCGKSYMGTMMFTRKDSSVFYVNFEISPIDKDGNIIDSIIRSGKIEGFVFIGKKIDKIINKKSSKEYIERRILHKAV